MVADLPTAGVYVHDTPLGHDYSQWSLTSTIAEGNKLPGAKREIPSDIRAASKVYRRRASVKTDATVRVNMPVTIASFASQTAFLHPRPNV